MPALRELLELTTDDLWLLHGERRRRRRHDRPLDRRARGALRRGSTATRGSASASTRATGGRPASTSPTARRSTAALEELDERIGLDRLRVLHVNDSKTPLGSNRDRHELVGEGLIGDGLATFLGHPAFQALPAILETWEDKGRETEDLDRMRALRRKGRRRWASWGQ